MRKSYDRKTPIMQHLVARVKIDFETGCFNWLGQKNNKGYGVYRRLKGIFLAHRASYTLFKGPIPEDLCVCHKCDNPLCVNPEHLFLGTQKDNLYDMKQKGRLKTGSMGLTHCKRGHEFNKENTFTQSSGNRRCRICYNMKVKESYHRRKSK